MARTWLEVRNDPILTGVCQILDDHRFAGDHCECGQTLGTLQSPDPEPAWVDWIIHIKKIAQEAL